MAAGKPLADQATLAADDQKDGERRKRRADRHHGKQHIMPAVSDRSGPAIAASTAPPPIIIAPPSPEAEPARCGRTDKIPALALGSVMPLPTAMSPTAVKKISGWGGQSPRRLRRAVSATVENTVPARTIRLIPTGPTSARRRSCQAHSQSPGRRNSSRPPLATGERPSLRQRARRRDRQRTTPKRGWRPRNSPKSAARREARDIRGSVQQTPARWLCRFAQIGPDRAIIKHAQDDQAGQSSPASRTPRRAPRRRQARSSAPPTWPS
jgi:hypothetical protein